MSDAIRASHSSKRDAGVKNRLLGSGRRRGGIWENSTETRVLPYAKRSTGPGSMQETGRSGLVHWDDPGGWHGEGGGKGVQNLEHMYTHG